MSFTKGQIIFALFFFVLFIVVIARAYKMDRKYIKKHYKGAYRVLAFIIILFAGLWLLVRYMSTH